MSTRIIKYGAIASALLAIIAVWTTIGFPTLVFSDAIKAHNKMDRTEDIRLEMEILSVKIPDLEDRIDRLLVRKSRFELIEQTPPVVEQRQAIERKIYQHQRELKEAEIRKNKLARSE